MNKHSKNPFKFLRFVKPWVFLAVAIVSAFVGVSQLRSNNIHMVQLRNNVYQADKVGTDVSAPLQALQAYVTRHMNTNLQSGPNGVYPPIQLKYTYERLVTARGADAQKTNSQIYNDAQAYCESQNHHDVSGRNRVPCIQAYVTSHSTVGTSTIPDALYKFSFNTPRWSPDLAGWSLFVSVLSALSFIISLIYHRLLKKYN